MNAAEKLVALFTEHGERIKGGGARQPKVQQQGVPRRKVYGALDRQQSTPSKARTRRMSPLDTDPPPPQGADVGRGGGSERAVNPELAAGTQGHREKKTG